MMLLATASYALYGVLTKRWAIALPNWQSLYVQILFGVLLLLPNFLMAQDVGLNGPTCRWCCSPAFRLRSSLPSSGSRA